MYTTLICQYAIGNFAETALREKKGGASYNAPPEVKPNHRLEVELQGELNLPGRHNRRLRESSLARSAGRCIDFAKNARSGSSHVEVVEAVETLGAELSVHSFCDLGVLDDGNIRAEGAGTRETVSPDVAQEPGSRSLIACRIEPLNCRLIDSLLEEVFGWQPGANV